MEGGVKMSYGGDPFAELRQGLAMGEQFVDACGSFPTMEQKEALSKNLYHIAEMERILRNTGTPQADGPADRCRSLQSRMRSLL
jgi:hypothetical protein